MRLLGDVGVSVWLHYHSTEQDAHLGRILWLNCCLCICGYVVGRIRNNNFELVDHDLQTMRLIAVKTLKLFIKTL